MNFINTRSLFLGLQAFFSLVFLSSATDYSYAEITGVWAVSESDKVFKYDMNHPARKGSSLWNGEKIQLQGLQNEVIAFQLIVEADEKGADAITIEISPPTHKTGRQIAPKGTTKYGASGTIEIYSAHYLKVTTPTKPQWYYGSENAAPSKMTGWIPDALIPSDAPHSKGGLPFTIAPFPLVRHSAGIPIQNQSFWVDLHLPRESQSFPTGVYRSSIKVRSENKTVVHIPLEVTLHPLALPAVNHSHVWIYSKSATDLQFYFPTKTEDEIAKILKFEAHRHRIDLTGVTNIHRSTFNEKSLNIYKTYLSGDAYQPTHGYHGPLERTGEKIFPIGIYGRQVLGRNRDHVRNESDKWVRWFSTHAPDVRYFLYLRDEPDDTQFSWIREYAGWIKSGSGPGRTLPIHITREYTEELKDVIDFWNVYNGPDLDRLRQLQMLNKDYWFYNGNRPRYGSIILEAPATNMRVNGWIKFLYDINTWFIWHSTHWTHNSQGPKNKLFQRVFNDPLTFINWKMEWGNGDGILFYPGSLPHQPQESRSLPLALPSIRLKNIRRGQQDFELLWMLEQKKGKKIARTVARQIVGRAMSEVSMSDPVSWSESGDPFDKARIKVISLLMEED